MSFKHFACEVFIICQKLLEINSRIVIQKHTSNSWSKLITQHLLDVSINAVSNEFLDLLSIKSFKWGSVDLRQLDHLLIHPHLLLSSWLLLHLLLWIHWSCLHWLRHAHAHLSRWFVKLLLLWVALLLVRIMLLIHVLILFGITSPLIVTTTSSPVISLSSSSVLVLLSSVIVIQLLIDVSLILILHAHLISGCHISVNLSKS